MLTLEVEPFQDERNTVCPGPGAEGNRAGMAIGVDIIKHNVVLRQVALFLISLTSVLRDSYSQHAQI